MYDIITKYLISGISDTETNQDPQESDDSTSNKKRKLEEEESSGKNKEQEPQAKRLHSDSEERTGENNTSAEGPESQGAPGKEPELVKNNDLEAKQYNDTMAQLAALAKNSLRESENRKQNSFELDSPSLFGKDESPEKDNESEASVPKIRRRLTIRQKLIEKSVKKARKSKKINMKKTIQNYVKRVATEKKSKEKSETSTEAKEPEQESQSSAPELEPEPKMETFTITTEDSNDSDVIVGQFEMPVIEEEQPEKAGGGGGGISDPVQSAIRQVI